MRIRSLILPLAFCLPAVAGMGAEKPNIMLFLVDDMGWQDTSEPFWTQRTPFNDRYQTPNMEKLADAGMKFTQAYASPVCSPTRVSLMTGLNAARHRVTDWTLNKVGPTVNKGRGELTVPAWNANGICHEPGLHRSVHAKCLPAFLREAGYRTIHVGKAHFGARKTPAEDPKAIGFDVNIAGHAPGGPASYLGTRCFAKNPENPGSSVWDVPGLEAYHNKDIFLTEALTLEANKAVDQAVADGKPFFLYMAHYAVHVPFAEDKRFSDRYKAMGLHPKEMMYATLIEGMDKSLGDILANVEKHGLSDNTIVLFMSDNGGLSAVGRGGKRHTHNKPLSSGKGSVREGGIRVPMIVCWPGVTKPESVCDTPVIIEDFFTTILEMAGIRNPQQIGGVLDGKSFVPLLKGESGKERELIWHYPNRWGPSGPGISFASAIRKGDWKLIYYHEPSKKVRFELFNIAEDIGETTNLFDKEPERARDLAAALTKRLKSMEAQMPTINETGELVSFPVVVGN